MIVSMRALYASAAFGVLVIAAACGGKVVFVEDDDGSGGSGASSTTTKTTTTTTKSTSKSTTSQVSTGVTSVTNGPTTVGVTSGGPAFCDFGSWGDQCQACIDQVVANQCEEVLLDCSRVGCLDYDACVFECGGNQGCCNQCENQFSPQAVSLHDQLLFCIFCQSCGPQCPEAVPGFCGF